MKARQSLIYRKLENLLGALMAGKNEYAVKRRVIKDYCPSFFDCFSVRGRFDSVRIKKNFSVKYQLLKINNYE